MTLKVSFLPPSLVSIPHTIINQEKWAWELNIYIVRPCGATVLDKFREGLHALFQQYSCSRQWPSDLSVAPLSFKRKKEKVGILFFILYPNHFKFPCLVSIK